MRADPRIPLPLPPDPRRPPPAPLWPAYVAAALAGAAALTTFWPLALAGFLVGVVWVWRGR